MVLIIILRRRQLNIVEVLISSPWASIRTLDGSGITDILLLVAIEYIK